MFVYEILRLQKTSSSERHWKLHVMKAKYDYIVGGGGMLDWAEAGCWTVRLRSY